MGHGPGSARSVETPLLVLKALDPARALDDRPHLPLDGSLPNSLVRLMLYGKSACNLIGLAFDSSPLDRLIVVAALKRHCVTPKRDDDITFRNAVVAPYTNFGRMVGNHDFAANRLRWSQPNQSC